MGLGTDFRPCFLALVLKISFVKLTFKFAALNRVTNMVDAAGTTTNAYWAGGRLKIEDGPWASDTVSYGYNGVGLRSSLTNQQPTGNWIQTYGYDAAKRLTNVTSQAGTFSYQYSSGIGGASSASALIQKLSLPNSSYITNTFDSVSRMLTTKLNNSSHSTLNSHGNHLPSKPHGVNIFLCTANT
jgi:YD repeat-containing protein